MNIHSQAPRQIAPLTLKSALAAAALLLGLSIILGFTYRLDDGDPYQYPTVRVERGLLETSVSATGTVASELDLRLSAPLAGRVTGVFANEGDRVSEGAVLVQLDDRQARARVREAQAGLVLHERQRDHLQQELLRLEGSRHAGGVSEQAISIARTELEVERARVELAKATLDHAQLQLGELSVRAPAPGLVAASSVRIGEWTGRVESQYIFEPKPLFRIVDPGRLYIEARIDAADLSQINNGQSVQVSSDLMPNQTWRERVTWIAPVITEEAGGRSGTVRIGLRHAPKPLPIGAQCDVRIITLEHDNALTVPLSAIRIRQGKPSVNLAKTSGQEWQPVKLGLETAERVEIVDGLREGDEVIIRPESEAE